MKKSKLLPNGCIGDNNAEYTSKMEGYATLMSDINEIDVMPDAIIKKGEKHD